MSLTRPRRLTLASPLIHSGQAPAARRPNAAQGSKGPRAVRGKPRVGFNALKLGLLAASSTRLADRLVRHPIRAAYDRHEALYGHIRGGIAPTFDAPRPLALSLRREQRCCCDGLATEVWCLAIRPQARAGARQNKAEELQKKRG